MIAAECHCDIQGNDNRPWWGVSDSDCVFGRSELQKYQFGRKSMVPEAGLEPAQGCPYRILSPRVEAAHSIRRNLTRQESRFFMLGVCSCLPLRFIGLGTGTGTV
jgi:hypothetical protein